MFLNVSFFNEEFTDGVFSGTLVFTDRNRQVVLDFDYDAEFQNLNIRNCRNPLYNSTMQTYEPDEIAEIYCDYGVLIVAEIKACLLAQYFYTTPREEY